MALKKFRVLYNVFGELSCNSFFACSDGARPAAEPCAGGYLVPQGVLLYPQGRRLLGALCGAGTGTPARITKEAVAHRFSRKCSSPSYCIKNLHPLAAEMVAAHKARQIEGLAGGCARSMMAAKSYCAAVLFLYLPFTICRPPRHGRARREQGSLVSGSRAGCRPGG